MDQLRGAEQDTTSCFLLSRPSSSSWLCTICGSRSSTRSRFPPGGPPLALQTTLPLRPLSLLTFIDVRPGRPISGLVWSMKSPVSTYHPYGLPGLSASWSPFQSFAEGTLFAFHVSLSCTEAEDTSEDDRRGKLRKSVHRNGLYSRCFTFNHNDPPLSLISKSRRIPLIGSLPPGELSIRPASKLVKRGCSDVRHGGASQIPWEIRLVLAMRPKNVNGSPTSCPSHELQDHLAAYRALSKLCCSLTAFGGTENHALGGAGSVMRQREGGSIARRT
ncbi:hypothetical protein BKA70DRAFT_727667 [Coprinopsis sp. MPI-PUGE-AT-0042]|nr:hypothetical protein BKA70DRAFT_727667 [Coprinopsis sp. MPI-PUGE-AT-0042]